MRCWRGWRAQQAARHLAESTKRDRALVRRFRRDVDRWPWEWRALDIDEWLEDLGGPQKRLSVSTLRGFQGALRAFLEYLCDERYPWAAICERELGCRPVQLIDERNRITHGVEFEGDPGETAVVA